MGLSYSPSWYELSYVAQVSDPASERQADNTFKVKAEQGFYTIELWAHLRRARLSIGTMIARWLTPQPPVVLLSKDKLVQGDLSADVVLGWLRDNTCAREGQLALATSWPFILQLLRSEHARECAAVQNMANLIKASNYLTSGDGHPKVSWKGHKGRALTHNGSVLTLTSVALLRLEALLAAMEAVAQPVTPMNLVQQPVDVHAVVQEILAEYSDENGSGSFVHQLAKEFLDYSVSTHGFRDFDGLVYQMVAMGFPVQARLETQYRL